LTWLGVAARRRELRCASTLAFVYLDEAYQSIINDLPSQPGLRQISLSYGLGESCASPSEMQTDDQYFAALAGAGVSVFVSSGDGGSSPGTGGHDHTGPVQVETPANDPNVTAVGGTSLNLNTSTGAVSSETAWYDGGGGISTIFARPTWQTGPGVPVPTVALAWHIAGAGDFNGDGFADLVWENTTTGQRAVWFLGNGVLFSSINLPTTAVTWRIADH
jgi:kumamolisin